MSELTFQKIPKRSVLIAGHRTSLSLESVFWDELKAIAALRKSSINQLIAQIDGTRTANLSSAIRVFVLDEIKKQIKS